MKTFRWIVVGFFSLLFAFSLPAAEALLPQRVLYVGHRGLAFESLLSKHFASVKTIPRDKFQPADAKEFDVVVLDWPQSGAMRGAWEDGAPLGKREEWTKPTVLLGSAGLNLAVAWKLKGGSGCTCLAPVAYDLRDHPIFKSPLPIDIKATIDIPTPEQFANELKEETIKVLPLRDGIKDYHTVINDNERGWSTHYFEFADMPEVEVFSGGINEQYPRSAAFWRQGNLLHFGFEQSPAQLNKAGQAMLVNAIVYISRFSEDRPIDVTPSVFAKERIGISRRRAKNYLSDKDRVLWATNDISAATLASFNWRNAAEGKAWCETNAQWLHPGKDNFLEIDEEARSLGVPFDAPDFLKKMIAALADEKTKQAASTLLARYVVDRPKDSSQAGWDKWWSDNSPYVFYSELGGYKWYIDPLAKKRGVPTQQLRGPARADIGK